MKIKKSFIKKHYKKILLSSVILLVAAVAVFTTVYFVQANSQADFAASVAATENNSTDADKTNYTLSFEKQEYKVEIGSKVESKVNYYVDKYLQTPNNLQYVSNNPDIATVDSSGRITGKAAGSTGIIAYTSDGLQANCYVTVTIPKEYMIKDVPVICQQPDYPSGCESVSTTMILQYYGCDITPDEFIDNYLPQDYFHESADGKNGLAGPDIASVFIGTPYSKDALGCLPPVINYAVNNYFDDKYPQLTAVDISGSSMDNLITNYIAKGEPVLIWSTMNMWQPVVTYEWTVENAADYSTYKDGQICQWLANEHCLVLIGYDEDYYYFNDPNYSSAPIPYGKEIFEERYKELGKCAIIITRSDDSVKDTKPNDKNETEEASSANTKTEEKTDEKSADSKEDDNKSSSSASKSTSSKASKTS